MRIVVTGASGNIGTALLRRLSDVHDVVGVVRRPPAAVPPYDVSWVALDLTASDAAVRLQSALAGADAVVHLVWGFQPSHDLAYLERIGVGGTRAVLEAAHAAGVGHLVHMSSIGAYAPRVDEQPVDETFPTTGVPTSPYSRHKVAAERLLDAYESRADASVLLTRIRPGIVGQSMAGSELLRYGVPALVPAALLRHVPVLPLDRGLVVPIVHADDVADAVVRVLDQRAGGAFNLAAEPPITRDDLAAALGAHAVHVPAPLLRLLASGAWHARVQPVDPGWLDLAMSVPVLDTSRARTELGWAPTTGARTVLDEVLAGLSSARSGGSPALRPRSVVGQLAEIVRRGPASHRRLP